MVFCVRKKFGAIASSPMRSTRVVTRAWTGCKGNLESVCLIAGKQARQAEKRVASSARQVQEGAI